MGASTYTKGKIVDSFLRGVAYTPPAALYLGLHFEDPETAGTEMSGDTYTRKAITWGALSGTTTTGPLVAITFPTPGADWGEFKYWCVWDASLGGHPIWHGLFQPSVTVLAGTPLTINTNTLSIAFTS